MITGTSIAKHAVRILGYIDNAILPQENAAQGHILNALYSMHKLSPACAIITCPMHHKNFFYVSENCQSIFGYTPQYMADHFRILGQYFSQIHEADMNDVKGCMDFYESFLQNESPQHYHKLRTVLHYRFRNAAGKYIYLEDQKATLVLTEQNVIHYSLIRAMPDEAVFSGVKIEIYNDEVSLRKIVEYKPSVARNKLSNRENDLVGLIKKGLTTKEIATHLSISHNTVRNIKSKLFEKYGVNNMIELLNMTG